ncbi:MFS transporter, UMF1 family [Legionella lansingensis]|uniref:MFS transporter family transporter protein n=1 Tax=Legionella lansingensis TaxID=45067 RepID=A0A0W0VLN5_9GAMM|nr:MFS transporter [Legionella lansingensis]KTD20993.1 MFS transporter family transporter protein [Legionella lansingensis]SNV44836.1 MFS transporter, UMF1 family [Legionella lansingensis]
MKPITHTGFDIRQVNIKQIIAWALYDFANSSYFVVIFTFVFATYFTNEIAANEIEGTALWGYTISASALLIAVMSPFAGALADFGGYHKSWLFFFTYLGIISTACLWFAYPNQNSVPLALACIFISNFALEVGTVFYNSFLPKLSPPNYIGRISGWAWGCGYLGGLLCLIIALVVFIKGDFGLWFGKEQYANIRAITLFVALWICIFSLPLFIIVQQQKSKQFSMAIAIKKGTAELLTTLKNLPGQKDLLLFLVARIFYIDGLNSVLALGGIYAAGTFKLSISDIMTFGIILNITAGFGAALFSWFDDWIGSKKTIFIALGCLTLTFCFLLTVKSAFIFWIFAPVIGIFVGPTQAASRTFLARLAKPEEITRMYGLYSLSGKATSFLGPLLVGLVTVYTDSQRWGMSILLPFFIIGGALLYFVNEQNKT